MEDLLNTYLNRTRISRRNAIAITIGGVAVVAVSAGGYYALLPQDTLKESKTEPVPVVPEAPAEKRSVRIALQGEVSTLSPLVQAMITDNGMAIQSIYATPFRVVPDAAGQGTISSFASLSYDPIDGKDFSKMRMILRKGVKFSNGDELTADSFVHSVNQFNKEPSTEVRFKVIEKMDVVDDYTIDVTNKSNNLTNRLNASAFFFVFMHPSQEQEQLNADPIGAGPFVKKSFIPGSELTLERVKDWWGDKIPEAERTTFFKAKGNIDEVSFVTIREISAAVTALRSGDVDMVAALSLPSVAEVREIPNVEAVSTGPLGWLFFHINSLVEPLSDLRVRRAINHSIDRSALLNLYANLVAPLDTLIPQGKFGYDPSIKNYEFDLEKAKTLMEDAGQKDGFDLTLIGITSVMDPQRMDSTIAISEMMKEIGIDAPPLQEDSGAWIRTVLDRTQTRIHMFPFRRSMTFRAPDDVLAFFERNIMPEGGQLATVDHEDLIELVKKARSSADPSERDGLYRQAQKIYMDQAIGVNYALFVGYQGISKRVTAPRWPSEQFIFPYTLSV